MISDSPQGGDMKTKRFYTKWELEKFIEDPSVIVQDYYWRDIAKVWVLTYTEAA